MSNLSKLSNKDVTNITQIAISNDEKWLVLSFDGLKLSILPIEGVNSIFNPQFNLKQKISAFHMLADTKQRFGEFKFTSKNELYVNDNGSPAKLYYSKGSIDQIYDSLKQYHN
jgi:hypothetical protein